MVLTLSTAVKNRRCILSAMTRFEGEHWYNSVFAFFASKTVQYTLDKTPVKIATVHIPNSFPHTVSTIWLKITEKPTVDTFLDNLWAAQLRLDAQLMTRQKVLEVSSKRSHENAVQFMVTNVSDIVGSSR